MSEYEEIDPSALGPNMWLVDEMYRRYRENPEAVDERWREFFEDFRPRLGEGESSGRTTAASKEAPGARKVTIPEGAERIRFGAERVVKNMKASLEVPTATSFRFVPAKLLEENRRVMNRFLSAGGGGKVSFTHLIGYAVLRALESVPVMKSSYLEVEGEPYVLRREFVNLGLAVDVEKEDGSHSLLVPNIKAANDMDFSRFWAAYEDVIRKVRTNKLTPDDFSGTTVTITNPGTIGTQLSVPRLLRGQGLIVGVGRIDYPAEWQGA
ncbi:MAG TPA: 2-oxo acid dehydrogenase subunit E2, partial [Actinomycetota bacterium]|nr:2-oxo acid dehydrogenase subunit E2 [Actinomycetota bacterium]